MTEEERQAVSLKISSFQQQWTKQIMELLLLPSVKFDDIEKLRGCHLVAKEDPSVFVTPMFCADDDEDINESPTVGGQQGLLDTDYAGFSFAPLNLMTPIQSRPRKCEAFFEVVLPYNQFCGLKSWVSSWRRFDAIAILGS